ncbi:MAG: YihY/virulence factor BrkB family protein [Acidimicrobiia bacterium]
MSTADPTSVPRHTRSAETDRGRHAESPTQVPVRGWRDVLARTRREMKDDRVDLLAAGVAFYALLALVPALVALVSIYGLVASPADVTRQIGDMLKAAPAEARDLVMSQLTNLTRSNSAGASLGAVIGIVAALWSASSGMRHLIEAVNLAYDEDETRGWLGLHALALALTIGAIVFVVAAFALITVLPSALASTTLGTPARVAFGVLRWPLLFLSLLVGLAVVYRYAPDRDEPKWSWASPGAVAAASLWLLASLAFSVYAANFARFNETYGSLGGVVVLMLWLLLTAFAVIFGAELNAELERQTKADTTEGAPAPMGTRDATAADTLGETADQAETRRER